MIYHAAQDTGTILSKYKAKRSIVWLHSQCHLVMTGNTDWLDDRYVKSWMEKTEDVVNKTNTYDKQKNRFNKANIKL